MIRKVNNLVKKSVVIIKDDGAVRFVKRAANYAYYKKFPDKKQQVYKDILFIKTRLDWLRFFLCLKLKNSINYAGNISF